MAHAFDVSAWEEEAGRSHLGPAGWLEELATHLDDLSLITRPHRVERTDTRRLPSDLHKCTLTIRVQKKKRIFFKEFTF